MFTEEKRECFYCEYVQRTINDLSGMTVEEIKRKSELVIEEFLRRGSASAKAVEIFRRIIDCVIAEKNH